MAAGGGGYLVESIVPGAIPALAPYSVALRFGAERLRVEQGNVNLPTGGAPTTGWLSSETATAPDAAIAFGDSVAAPKMLSVFQTVSRNLLLQSAADEVLRRMMVAGAAAAVDAAVIGGSGLGGEPQGIVGTAGVNAFTGASLDYAAIVAAHKGVADADGLVNPAALGFATTPTVAALLKARHRVASTDSPLWVGNLSVGVCEGTQAIASRSVPTGAAVYGDWSSALVIEWGTPSFEVDPYASFKNGVVGVRLLVPIDIIVQRPAAFAVATAIT